MGNVWKSWNISTTLCFVNCISFIQPDVWSIAKVVSAPIVGWKDFYLWAFYISAFHSSRLLTCSGAFPTTLSLSQSTNSSTCYKTGRQNSTILLVLATHPVFGTHKEWDCWMVSNIESPPKTKWFQNIYSSQHKNSVKLLILKDIFAFAVWG